MPLKGTMVVIIFIASPNILGLKLGKLPEFLTFSPHVKNIKMKGHQREVQPVKRLLLLLLDLSV